MEVFTLPDLLLLRQAHIQIDAADFAEALWSDNLHRDLGPCNDCRAKTYEQHGPWCARSSLLHEKNWYRISRGRGMHACLDVATGRREEFLSSVPIQRLVPYSIVFFGVRTAIRVATPTLDCVHRSVSYLDKFVWRRAVQRIAGRYLIKRIGIR